MRTFIFLCCFSVFSITPKKLTSQNAKIAVNDDKFIYPEALASASNVNENSKQELQVSGVVVDVNGQPLPGANIVEKGTANGAQTDFDGNFSLNLKSKDAVLVVSFVGFTTQEVSVEGKTQLNIKLIENATSLNEVVVVGYGSQKKSDLTGAVAQISADDFESQPMTSVDQALQGRLAGVQVTQNNGVPGSGFKIRVRGSGSFGNNDPLYVIDGFIGGSTANLAPEDIETISVLKDASATAIYGNRASGGVVIITTKRGKEGKNTVEVNSFVSIGDPIGEFDVLNGADFAELVNKKNIEQGGSATYSNEEIAALQANGGTNWQDEIFQTAITNNYQLAFSGGGPSVSYYVSANHSKQEGLIKHTKYERFGFRANIDAKINDKLDVDFSVFATSDTRENGTNSVSAFGAGNLMAVALTFDPTTPVYDTNGDYNLFTINNVANQGQNPLFLASVADRTTYGKYLQSRIALNYKIANNLDLNVALGASSSYSNYREYVDARIQNGNTATSDVGDGLSYQNTNRLTYANTFNDKHNVSADFIFEQSQYEGRSTSAYAENFPNSNVGSDNLGLGSNQRVESGASKSSLESYIGRVTYGFDDRYLLSGSIRADKSSKFLNDQTGIFPSFSLGWNISNEDFFGDNIISNLKFRGGWGVTGSDRVDTQAAHAFLTTGGNNYVFGGNLDSSIVIGIAPSEKAANPNLTWEETKQTNIGLDYAFLNGKISGSFDYYNKKTEGLLMRRNLPNYTGSTYQWVNAAAVENKGFEFSINAYPVTTKDFSWEIGANFSTNKNKVLELVDGLDQIELGGDYNSFSGAVTIVKVGEALGSFYGYEYTGPDPTTGDATYKDLNGDNIIDAENDRAIMGNGNPDFVFGVNNNVTYKGLELNIFVQSLQGNEIYNAIGTSTYGWGAISRHSTNPNSLNSWTPTNTDTNIPRLNSTVKPISTFSIEDGSFIRLKNISLGYNLPSETLKNIGISSAKVYVSGQNLLTWTDYSGFDPEVSSGGGSDIDPGVDNGVFPNTKTVTVGINVNF
ncbi:SusC/RagA family TonB-linked outer membrane protein [Algibacter miyuki]|uniref:SusC/RagA family TonB-linked outer membrane protein n=1 Tax=Algibacter miyuki TaxID=1306933 RepID=A0ABV5H2T2_9FLAO|nr:TonB-dependent receptor [Algibacter miyuki]MDN3663878.1 TonB-dependent receptor [Algibacter miyuki]